MLAACAPDSDLTGVGGGGGVHVGAVVAPVATAQIALGVFLVQLALHLDRWQFLVKI